MFRDIISRRYDPIILFIEDRINCESFLIGKDENSISEILQVIQQMGDSLQTLLNHCCTQQGFLETSQIFLLFFNHPGYSRDWNFLLLCQSFIFWQTLFSKAFLMSSWLVTWDLPDRGRFFRVSEVFKRYYTRRIVIVLTFSSFEFLVNISILVAFSISDTWHLVTFYIYK